PPASSDEHNYRRNPLIGGSRRLTRVHVVNRVPRRYQRRGMVSESLGLTSHKSSCNCTGCGMLRAGVCINCAEKTAALILESGPGEVAVEPLFEELSLMGITAGSLFPGIDGACEQLRDRFFGI